MSVFGRKQSGFSTPAYPADMERFSMTTRAARHTSSTGMP
jgi:hypothetical protein